MRALLLPAVLAATALAPMVQAQATASQDGYDLGTLYIAGGLTPLRFGDYARAASVVTDEEIAARGLSTVREALTGLPGVSVNSRSNSFSQIRIRGGEGNHTLVLIDGIEAAGGDGEYFLSGLSADNISRIEVLRGPQSVFYGSNASSGVVNIVTRSGREGTQYGGSAEVGDGYGLSAHLSRRGARGGVALNFSDRRDDGYDISGSGGERDEIARRSVAAKGDVEVAPGLTLGAIFRRAEDDYDYDGADGTALTAGDYVIDTDNFAAREEMTRSLWAEYEMMGGALTHRLAWERTDTEQSIDGAPATEADTRSFEYIASVALDGRAVAATDHQMNLLLEDEEDSSSTEPGFDRSTRSLALEYRGAIGRLDLQAGLRRDWNEPFEDQTTYTLAASFAVTEALRVHASAGRGVVNPTYDELYYNQTFAGTRYLGNPGLVPETNESVDLGVELAFAAGRGLVDLTYFAETLENEIVTVPVSPTLVSYANEAGESDRQGVEIEARWRATDALSLRAAHTYLDAENADGSVEIRRPRNETAIGASLAFAGDRARVSADLRHVSGLFDNRFFGDFAEGVELDDFTTVDIAARFALTDEVALTGRIENAFDADYSEVLGYATRGRTIRAGLVATF